jgi:hypothetical protein
MKNLILLCLVFAFFNACEPSRRECTDPTCLSSPISVNLKAKLSDSASTFRVGDTLKLNLKIPDTLSTNQGNFNVGSVQNVELFISYLSSKTFGDSTTVPELPPIIVSKGSVLSNGGRIFRFKDNRELELLFVFPKKSNYYIAVSPQPQRLEITDKNGAKYLLMLNVGFDVKDGHKNLYLSWLSYGKNQAEQTFRDLDQNGFGYFCFKVE